VTLEQSLGIKTVVPVRLITLRVPKEVAEERQARIIEKRKPTDMNQGLLQRHVPVQQVSEVLPLI